MLGRLKASRKIPQPPHRDARFGADEPVPWLVIVTSVIARKPGQPGSACGNGFRAPLGRMRTAASWIGGLCCWLLFVLAGGASGRRLRVGMNELT